MLDIQKELEKFNRLLEEVDEDAVSSPEDDSPSSANGSAEEHDVLASNAVTADDHDSDVADSDEVIGEVPATLAVAKDHVQDVPVSRDAISAVNAENGGDGHSSFNREDDGIATDSEVHFDEVRDDGASSNQEPITEIVSLSAIDFREDDSVDEPEEMVDNRASLEAQEAGAWMVTELVADPLQSTPNQNDVQESNIDDEAEVQLPASVDSQEPVRGSIQRHTDRMRDLSDRMRFPNPGGFSFEESVDATNPHNSENPDGVDSLLHGARVALTDSHHLRPARITPSFTVTLPEIEEHEEEDDLESLAARILPLLTFRTGFFEERLGAVVGAVAGLVILAAGVLFVPRLFSADEPQDIAEVVDTNAQDHLHASADPLVNAESALLSIATFPPGARVYLNSELIGVTPFRDVAVDRGEYQLSVEKKEFAAIDTFLVFESSKEFFFDLSAEEGLLTQDVAENVDHQLLQVAVEDSEPRTSMRSSNRSSERSSNEASESIARTNDRTSESRSNTNSNRRSRVETPSVGALVVTSEPMGATVFLDDREVGETPATLSELVTGSVTLSLRKEGFVPYETEINVMPSIQTPFHAALAPVKASLFVNATAGGDLYVDGQLVSSGIIPGHRELVAIGKRNVKIVHSDYGEYVTVVDVTADNKASVSVDMVTHGYTWSIENGDRLFSESRYQEAIENYRRALNIRPGNAGLENKMALAAKAMAETSMPTVDSRTAPADGIYSVTDTAPQLIGGLAALHANVVYPEEAYNEGIQGRVYVQFVVDEEGRAQDLTIARGLKGGCNEAAIRAIKRSRFKPATVNGVPVKARHTLFVNFTI